MNQSKSPLHHARRELEVAKRAIERMIDSESMDDFEDEWRIFLGAIEKSWVKAERAGQAASPKFQPWQGHYQSQRKSDQLLKYLYHARHSDQHSIQEMLERKSASQQVTIGGPGDSIFIEKLVIDGTGNISEYRGSHPLIVTGFPNRVELTPVLSSKKWYQPPNKHLEKVLKWPAPLTVAQLGLEYYENFLSAVEKHFFLRYSKPPSKASAIRLG